MPVFWCCDIVRLLILISDGLLYALPDVLKSSKVPPMDTFPFFENVTPVPKLIPVEWTNESPTVSPVLCKFDDPVLKLVAVETHH